MQSFPGRVLKSPKRKGILGMKREFVKTENAKRFRAHVALQENRGSQESGWIVVHGRPGEGKTRTLHNWASENGALMLTAQVDWTVRRMMVELADKLGIEPSTGFERRIDVGRRHLSFLRK